MHGVELVAILLVGAALTVAYVVIGASLGISASRERKRRSGKRID